MSLGSQILFYRTAKGMTQEDLAKRVGTTPQNIYKYEKGIVTSVPLSRLELIAEALDVSPAVLAGWKEEGPAQKDEAKREEFMRLYEAAPAWLRDQVRSLLEAAEAGREAQGGDPKAR